MKLGVFGRIVSRSGQTDEAVVAGDNQYTDERSTIGDYLRRTGLPRLTMDFERDATIFSEGEAALDAFVVVDGTVRFCRNDVFAGRRILGHAKQGDLILPFANLSHLFSAETASPVTLMVYTLDRIGRLAAIDTRLEQLMAAHRAAHRHLASGTVSRAMNVLRNSGLSFPPQQDAITRSLKLHGAYAGV